MEILNDSTATQTIHTRTVTLSNAPKMKTNNFYNPEQMWQPDTLTVEWVDGQKPLSVVASGLSDDHGKIERSYGWDRMPEWIKETLEPGSVKAPDLIVSVNPREVVSVPKPVAEKPKLVRHKIGDRNYQIYTRDRKLVGFAAMTGEYGRDSYPWDWHLTEDLARQLEESDAPKHHKSGGSSDSLRDIIDMMASKIARYGLKP